MARLDELIRDAQAAGYEVTGENMTIRIVRRDKRGKVRQGLVIYPDGTAVDVMVDLSAARGIRSYNVMRRILGLTTQT